MKPIKLLAISVLFGALAAVPMFSRAQTDAAKPAEAADTKPQKELRKITARYINNAGSTFAEVTVPALSEQGEFQVNATVMLPNGYRRLLSLDVNPGEMSVEIMDPERPSLQNGEKGLVIGSPLYLFDVRTLYSGPGEYEIYRNPQERLVIVIQ